MRTNNMKQPSSAIVSIVLKSAFFISLFGFFGTVIYVHNVMEPHSSEHLWIQNRNISMIWSEKMIITDTKTNENHLARGINSVPLSENPALVGAKRGQIQCDVNVNDLAYWNDPQGSFDISFQSPFADRNEDKPKYVSFEPDLGGWNNIRMAMEILFVFAVATGRTLVMPPEQEIYLLDTHKNKKNRGYDDFYSLDNPELQKHVKIISTEEFLRREGKPGDRFEIPSERRDDVWKVRETCVRYRKGEMSCYKLFDYLREVGFVPKLGTPKQCFIFDEDAFHGGEWVMPEKGEAFETCMNGRTPYIYNSTMHEAPLIHFHSDEDPELRLLGHFYGFFHFSNPTVFNHLKRFVRDFLRYNDQIYCAAGKIVHSLQQESIKRGFSTDSEGGGGYSSFHIRHGDFQYKESRINSTEWYENTKELFQPNEILYIATDERNKTFFDPLAKHHDLRFLDDYTDVIGDVDPASMGMIETIVASRGRIFVGTYFSTFSGFINRMRGYHGMTMKDSYYGTLDRKYETHTWGSIPGASCGKEWPAGWRGIDGNEFASRDIF